MTGQPQTALLIYSDQLKFKGRDRGNFNEKQEFPSINFFDDNYLCNRFNAFC